MLNVSLDTHLQNFHLHVAFESAPGTTTVLLGESGAGKTTVLRAMAGLITPQHGYIAFNEQIYVDTARAILRLPQYRPFGYVFQDYVLFPHLSVFENIAFGLRAQRLARKEITARVGETLEMLGLTSLEQRRPAQLSGGQQQRVAIARALVLRPQILLLDEPLAALDVQTRREVRQELRRLLADLEMTTVMVTHQYVEALLFGQQILVLDRGRIIQSGGQQELRDAPRSPYVAELVGVNFFRGRITGYETDMTCSISLPELESELLATLRERSPGEPVPHPGTEAYVIVAPQSVTLHTQPPEGSARNIIQGEILHILHTGTGPDNISGHIRVSIRPHSASMQPVTAEVTAGSVARLALHEGQTVYATFKATEALAYL